MWDFLVWLFYAIDWRIQVMVLGILMIVGYVLVRLFFGATIANKLIPALAGALAVAGAATRLRQAGYKDRLAEEEKAQERAEDVQEKVEDEVHRLPDDKLDQEVDRWTKQ